MGTGVGLLVELDLLVVVDEDIVVEEESFVVDVVVLGALVVVDSAELPLKPTRSSATQESLSLGLEKAHQIPKTV